MPADIHTIWDVLTNPEVLADLTPMLRHIEVDGDHWRWELTSIRVLTTAVTPSFTEQMTFLRPSRIDFSHEPPPGRTERVGADGVYRLDEVAGGTHLRISLTISVDLPLGRAARPAVERIMGAVIARTGDRFSENLLRHLGLPT